MGRHRTCASAGYGLGSSHEPTACERRGLHPVPDRHAQGGVGHRSGSRPAPAHDAFTRLLHRLEPDPAVLWDEARPSVRPGGAFVFDDSVLGKPFARHMGLARRCWSGRHRRVVTGIGLVTLLWTDGDALVPCDYRLPGRQRDEERPLPGHARGGEGAAAVPRGRCCSTRGTRARTTSRRRGPTAGTSSRGCGATAGSTPTAPATGPSRRATSRRQIVPPGPVPRLVRSLPRGESATRCGFFEPPTAE